MIFAAALLSLCFISTSDDAEAAELYQARVFIGDGTVDGTVEFQGSGSTLKELLSDAIGSNGHIIEFRSNGTVSNLDNIEVGSKEALCIYKWTPLKGWVLVIANAEGNTTLEDGTSYYVYKSQKWNNFDTGLIEYPGPKTFEPISTGYFCIKMIEDVNANDYVKSILTEDQRRAGFWISGQGSDMAEAFYDACRKMRESGNSGFELEMNLEDGNYLKGWLGSFMGLLDVKLNEKEYKYWSQFCWDSEKNDWVYSDCMGYYDPGVMPYFSVIRQITLENSAVPVGTQYPSDIPTALKDGSDLAISYLGFDGAVAHTEKVPYFGSLPEYSLGDATLSNGDTVAFSGWNVSAGNGFRALSDMQISPMFDYDAVIAPSSDGQIAVDLTESDYLALSSTAISSIKTNASSAEFKVKGGSITLDADAISSLEERTYAVAISSASLDALPGEVAEQLEGSEIFEISFGGQHSFGDGELSISMDYTAPEGKDASRLQVYHIVDGKKVPIQSSYSDGGLSFAVDSLSYFAVAYDARPEDNGGDQSMILYAAVGAVAVIALAGTAVFLLRKNRS